jgi:hypothetical protein
VVSGLVGTAVLIGFSLLTGPLVSGENEQLQRFYTYVWLAAVVGTVAALLIALIYGDRGRGAALLTGPIAAAVVSAGFLGLNTARGGALTLDFSLRILLPTITLAFLLYVVLAWLALAPVGRSGHPTALVVSVTAILAAAGALGVIAGRDVLVPGFDQLTAMQPNQVMIVGQVIDYKTRTGPGLLTRRLQLNKTASSIATDPNLTGADRAARYRSEVVVPLRRILVDAESYVPPDDRVATVHQHCIAALRLAATANENLAHGFELNNRFLLTQGEIGLQTEHAEWHTWLNEVSQL